MGTPNTSGWWTTAIELFIHLMADFCSLEIVNEIDCKEEVKRKDQISLVDPQLVFPS